MAGRTNQRMCHKFYKKGKKMDSIVKSLNNSSEKEKYFLEKRESGI
jgi:hypothetical protein